MSTPLSWVKIAEEISKWAAREAIRYNELYDENYTDSQIQDDPEYRYARQQRVRWEERAARNQ